MATIMTPRGPVVVDDGLPFTETIQRVARDAGMKTLRVFVAGVELVDEMAAPATISGDVTIYPYDTPA